MLAKGNINNSYTLQSYAILCALIGICYATTFGLTIKQDIIIAIVDTIVSASLLFILSIALWNIFEYNIPHSINIYQSVSLHVLYAAISIIVFIGIESAILYVIFPLSFAYFAHTLPARLFSLALLYNIYRLYYSINKDDSEEEPENMLDNPIQETNAKECPIIDKITVKIGQKIKVIPIDDLIYLKADDDYVSIVTAEGHWLKNETMKEYEACLPQNKFARVHRSYIVNINKITKIERYGQKQSLHLTNGESLRISSNGYKILRLKLNL